MLRPAREIGVAQVVFDRSVMPTAQDAEVPRGATVQAPGWLEAEPFLVACTALADGVLESIAVLEGDRVEAGQVVARLVAEDSELRLRRAAAELAGAEAGARRARADLAAAESTWAEPVELERAVESGRAAVAEGEAELAQLPTLVAGARATLVRLEEEAVRVERSRAGGATTAFERIIAEQRSAAQRAEVGALEARRPILEARLARLRAELRAAERDLALRIEDQRRVELAKAAVAAADASVARASAAHDEAELELERMTIRAPITGYVQRRLKAPGDKVIRMMDSVHSAHVLHLYDPDRLQVRVDVPLADASHLFVGQACEVVVEVLPDRVFRGELLRITHEADLQKNTLQVKVRVLDPDPVLRPEMLTRVKFLPEGAEVSGTGETASRVLVPSAAVDTRDGAARVWVVTDRGQGRGVLSARPVEITGEDAGWSSVSGQLQPGALVAVRPELAREGERVVIGRGG